MSKALFWFRRDLRLSGNQALEDAINNGATEALFFVCEKQWQLHNTSEIQIDLVKRRVDYLGNELAKLGIKLHVINGESFDVLPSKLEAFINEHSFTQIFANREYEINELNRDTRCASLGAQLHLYDGDVLCSPGSIVTKGGEMFKVFTPFKKAWLAQYSQYIFKISEFIRPVGESIPWQTPTLLTSNGLSDKWPVDDAVLSQVIEQFLEDKISEYSEYRDIPSIKGTSGLSPYLALGIISATDLIARIQQRIPDVLYRTKISAFTYINELLWREFYRHLMFIFPKLCKSKNFNEKYNAVQWLDDENAFAAWCEGNTGYPIVDAAMRQLNQTGWMHNRLRMIVASFLTKHLLIDWRRGEAYFMSKLIDGDLAANNGGWQWAASTGCDAQPYFRIFNPITQSEKFDPDGTFIRKYVHELEWVPAKYIHFPHDYINAVGRQCYTAPIVEHKEARARALDAFKV
ncbi:deoxyribodipyrimidine photo-lyase [Pseudoalteromonas luteoviolacea]|uniref:deoxyribodipyrimidine photo-lyase n=1 Tax=Pseudoalteromonas luteoviolacea TaxID=43657 RepID=UPI001F27FF8B|nr:deoxyribodipyrimidine photo-lyase [Pseudoalteromonas luteoviolacea]MCF6439669.1 deoxyribodipyrimidine photo-lyase [Pseudoalteromonas luteoviolacea]